MPDGSIYVTEMSAARQQVTRLFDGGRKLIKRTGGRPNGSAVDGDGNLWIAEAGLHAVLVALIQAGAPARPGDEQPLRLPNDLCFGKNGLLYVTDSGDRRGLRRSELRRELLEAARDGRVYELDPVKGKVLRILDRRILLTNGIAFGPDDALWPTPFTA